MRQRLMLLPLLLLAAVAAAFEPGTVAAAAGGDERSAWLVREARRLSELSPAAGRRLRAAELSQRRGRALTASPDPCTYVTADTLSATELVNTLLGSAASATFTTSGASYTGNLSASGLVQLTSDPDCDHFMRDLIGTDAVVLTTGSLEIASRTANTVRNATVQNGGPSTPLLGNPDDGAPSMDAATLTFTLLPKVNGQLSWKYLFASEEYPEYVGSKWNDGFRLLVAVNGSTGDVAVVPNTTNPTYQIAINSVNDFSYAQFYQTNSVGPDALTAAPGNLKTEYDGMTTLLETQAVDVRRNVPMTITIVIADVADAKLDSAVFLKTGSLQIASADAVVSAQLLGNTIRSWSWGVTAANLVDKDANGKINWRNTVTSTEILPAVLSPINGTLTVISPNGGKLANVVVTVTGGTGTCTAPACPTYDLPYTDPVYCPFTCDATVTSVRPSATVDTAPMTGAVANVTRTDLMTDSRCVLLNDALFAQQEPAAWSAKTLCFTNATAASPYVLNFNTLPPSPDPQTQCQFGVVNYTATNVAVLNVKTTGDAVANSSATATVSCPLATFTTTASCSQYRNYNWAMTMTLNTATLTATNMVWTYGAVKTVAADTFSTVTGSFTLASPRGGLITEAAVTTDLPALGACNTTCPLSVAAGGNVICTFTCPGGVSYVKPTCKIDGYQLTGAQVTVAKTVTQGPTNCVIMTSPALAKASPAWSNKSSCATITTASWTSKPLTPLSTECLSFVNTTYQFDVVTLLVVSTTPQTTLQTITTTVTPRCPTASLTVASSFTNTRNWAWTLAANTITAQTNSTTPKIVWGTTLTNQEVASTRARTTGTLTLKAPTGKAVNVTGVSLTPTGTGACTFNAGASCLTAMVKITTLGGTASCAYSCDDGVTAVAAAATFGTAVGVSQPVSAAAVNVVNNTVLSSTTNCVFLAAPKWKELEPSTWTANKTFCQSSGATQTYSFTTRTPDPLTTECVYFSDNYAVTSPVVIQTTATAGTTLGTASSVASIPCPKTVVLADLWYNTTNNWNWDVKTSVNQEWNTASSRTVWNVDVDAFSAAMTRTQTVGRFTVRSPRAGQMTAIVITPSATAGGTCSAPTCPAGSSTLTAGLPVQCTFTCADDVIGVTVGLQVNAYPFTSDPTAVSIYNQDGDTACVRLSDPLFSSQAATWQDRVICYSSLATSFQPFTVETSRPTLVDGQCGDFTTFQVTNTAVLKTNTLGAAVKNASATATVPCPTPGFLSGTGVGGGGGSAALTANSYVIRNWNWTLASSVVMNRDANGMIVWRSTLTKQEVAGTPIAGVSGTFTIVSPRNGALTSAIVTGTDGTCGTPACGVTQLVINVPVTCNYTCTTGTTSVVASFAVDGYNVASAAVTSTPAFVDSDTACVSLEDPILAAMPGTNWNATAASKICYNATGTNSVMVDTITRPPTPAIDQCRSCAPNYTVPNTATIRTFGKKVLLGTSSATAVVGCTPCSATLVLNGTITRNWDWDIDTSVISTGNTLGQIEWQVNCTKKEVEPTKNVSGVVTVTAPANSTFTVTAEPVGGTCGLLACPTYTSAGTPVACTITCQPTVTSATTTLIVDSAPPAVYPPAAVTFVTVKGNTSCVTVAAPLLAQIGPANDERGAWLNKGFCDTTAETTVTKPIVIATVPPGNDANNSCTACQPTYTLVNTAQVLDSAGNVIATATTNVTKPCPLDKCVPTNCATAVNGTCATCLAGFLKWGNTCVASCPAKTYAAGNGTCVSCPVGCAACGAGGVCSSCLSGFLLVNGTCPAKIPCPSTCSACDGLGTCTACIQGFLLSSGKCATSCGEGTFLSNGTCAKCSEGCASCTSATTCTKCKSGIWWWMQGCVNVCPVGFWPNSMGICTSGNSSSSSQCDIFIKHCMTCKFQFYRGTTTKAICTKCEDGYAIKASGRACYCAPGYYTTEDTSDPTYKGFTCKPCGNGAWCPGAKVTAESSKLRMPCGKNLITMQDLSKAERECVAAPGYGWADGNASDLCPIGKYNPGFNSRQCSACPGGLTTEKPGAQTTQECVAGPGYYYLRGKAMPCGRGNYKETYGNDDCTPCPNGLTTPTGVVTASAASQCTVLKPGFSIGNCPSLGVTAGVDCPSNTFRAGEVALAECQAPVPCTPCGSGMATLPNVTRAESADSCLAAPGYGWESDGTPLGIARICAKGQYNPGYNREKCIKCDGYNGTITTDMPGATRSDFCYTPAGHGNTRYADGILSGFPCPVNTYGRTNKTFGLYDVECTKCLDNSHTTGTTKMRNSDCLANPGYGYDDGAVNQCEYGYYNAGENQKACTWCGQGYNTSAAAGATAGEKGATAQSQCRIDFGYTSAANSSVVACTRGTYKNALGSAACSVCPAGTSTTLVRAAVAQTDCDTCRPGFGAGASGKIDLAAPACLICQSGTFSPGYVQGGGTCRACPKTQNFTGTMVSRQGASTPDECYGEYITDPANDKNYLEWDYIPMATTNAAYKLQPTLKTVAACQNACTASATCTYMAFFTVNGPDGDYTCYHRVGGTVAPLTVNAIGNWDAPFADVVLFEVRPRVYVAYGRAAGEAIGTTVAKGFTTFDSARKACDAAAKCVGMTYDANDKWRTFAGALRESAVGKVRVRGDNINSWVPVPTGTEAPAL